METEQDKFTALSVPGKYSSLPYNYCDECVIINNCVENIILGTSVYLKIKRKE